MSRKTLRSTFGSNSRSLDFPPRPCSSCFRKYSGLPAAPRAQRLRERLEKRFAPAQLTVEDESHLHEGHAGAATGQSHFRIRIVAEAFRGISSVARHRLIYAAVDDLMKSD